MLKLLARKIFKRKVTLLMDVTLVNRTKNYFGVCHVMADFVKVVLLELLETMLLGTTSKKYVIFNELFINGFEILNMEENDPFQRNLPILELIWWNFVGFYGEFMLTRQIFNSEI